MAETVCMRFWVSGRVQGVFYRASTRKVALGLGLAGYASNLPDGRVEVLACGEPAHVQQLETWLHDGPQDANVTAVQSEYVTDPCPEQGFIVQ